MDILSKKYISNVFRPVPVSAVIHTLQGRVNRLIEFFSLSEEDRLTAGISVGDDGRDEDTNPDESPLA